MSKTSKWLHWWWNVPDFFHTLFGRHPKFHGSEYISRATWSLVHMWVSLHMAASRQMIFGIKSFNAWHWLNAQGWHFRSPSWHFQDPQIFSFCRTKVMEKLAEILNAHWNVLKCTDGQAQSKAAKTVIFSYCFRLRQSNSKELQSDIFLQCRFKGIAFWFRMQRTLFTFLYRLLTIWETIMKSQSFSSTHSLNVQTSSGHRTKTCQRAYWLHAPCH